MKLDKELKSKLIGKHSFSRKEIDTGSPESQIALFTYRIKHITEHLKNNAKDHSTRLALIKLVGKRKKLLSYLHNNKIERYRNVLKDLSLRK